MPLTIAAPRAVEPPPPFRFPVLASIAPLGVAVVLWLVTQSPYSLLFALLGPVTLLASLADSRFGARRSRRKERARYETDARAAHEAIDAAHAEERAALSERTPAALALLGREGADPWRWSGTGPGIPVALGRGSVPSALRIEGDSDELERHAHALADAPVVVDASLGIGVCGPVPLATAVARSLVVQLAWALSPATYGSAAREPWAASLPHAVEREVRPGAYAEFGRRGEDAPAAVIAVAAEEAALPGECRVVLTLTPEGAAITQHPDRELRRPLRPGPLSAESALAWAQSAARAAEREGLVAAAGALPESVALASLPQPDRPGLECAIGADAAGPVTIDLVAQGPHAVVGGTTGSGKSELLISWVLAMASSAPPARLTVLLVDFKGGSAFAALERLPHTVGIVTDLDEAHATRALESLRAELRYRERAIASARGRSIDDVDLPRLVIVVDEFAAMLADHPDLHTLFVDIASRGRSLGVHLVLCTQRPAGVVRDAVLANADLRISLRVNNRADSSALVGTDAAAQLPARARGRGILAPSEGEPRAVQFALSVDSDVDRVASRWAGSPPPRRPWCEPLPPVVGPAEAPGGFGLLDLPHEQRRGTADWRPDRDGHVLVLGAARSGTSTALEALAPAARRLPSGIPAAWDVLSDFASARDTVLAVDDADSLLARFPGEYRAAVVERLAGLLRDGPARGLHVVLTAKRITADLQPLAALIPERLLLRHASKQDWLLAGGEAQGFTASLPPGGGVWHGHRVQVVAAPLPAGGDGAERVGVLGRGPLAVVTTRSRAVREALPRARSLADLEPGALRIGDVVVGDTEEWQSRWGALSAVQQVAEVVFDACSTADVRALTRSRELPPPLGAGQAWRLEPDGRFSRVRFGP
ncbi:MAG: cell division protein [Rhodoglobus sp.]|nr:cell division protein [Rhodoglobus sp.]